MLRALANVTLLSVSLALGACDRSAGPAPSPSASASAASSAVAPTRAVITIDAAHDVMTKKDAPAYAIAPSTELVLEIGDHRFATRDAGTGAPDTVHVARGSAGYHRASFSGKRISLSTASLDPVKGGAFTGFEAGESYIIAVGVEAPSASDGAMRFTPMWTAKVDVAAR